MDNWFRYYRQPKKYTSLIELYKDYVLEVFRIEEESNKKFAKLFKDLPTLSQDTKYKWMLELNTNFGDINIVDKLELWERPMDNSKYIIGIDPIK